MHSPVIKRFAQKTKTLFLIDGLGALLSAIFLSFVLPSQESLIGMPSTILGYLGDAACLLSLYSLSCAKFSPGNWRSFLFIIAGANLTYCCVTLALVLQNSDILRPLGWLYFLGEMAIIVALASVEIAVARQPLE